MDSIPCFQSHCNFIWWASENSKLPECSSLHDLPDGSRRNLNRHIWIISMSEKFEIWTMKFDSFLRPDVKELQRNIYKFWHCQNILHSTKDFLQLLKIWSRTSSMGFTLPAQNLRLYPVDAQVEFKGSYL